MLGYPYTETAHLYTIFSALHLPSKGHWLLPTITWQIIFHRCINQLLIMRFDGASYILGATVAHLQCSYQTFCEACCRVGSQGLMQRKSWYRQCWRHPNHMSMKHAHNTAGVLDGPWQSPCGEMIWLFDIQKTKKLIIGSLTNHGNSGSTPFSWLKYRLPAEYNTTWSRISHPDVVVIGQLELRRDIYSCDITFVRRYTLKSHRKVCLQKRTDRQNENNGLSLFLCYLPKNELSSPSIRKIALKVQLNAISS